MAVEYEHVKSDVTNEDTLYMIKRGFVKRSDGKFDYIIGFFEERDKPTYGVTLAIRNKVVYITFDWGEEYIEEALSILKNLPSGKPTFIVNRKRIKYEDIGDREA